MVFTRVSSYVTRPTLRTSAASDPRWTMAYVTPMRFADSGVSITGFPVESAAVLARGAASATFLAIVNHQAAATAATITSVSSNQRIALPNPPGGDDSKGERASRGVRSGNGDVGWVIWAILLPGAPAGPCSRPRARVR